MSGNANDGDAITPCLSTAPARLSPWGLVVLLTGAFVVTFDVFVVNVAIPSLKEDLHADFAEIGMVIAMYALAFGACLIVGGRIGDIFGRRRMFSLGMTGFAVASVLCGLATTPQILIGSRVLQGMCAALLFPQVYTLLRVLYDDVDRTRAFGLLGMTLGLAAIAGELLGGLMVWSDLFGLGWRTIFFVNLPVGMVAAVVARTIPESTSQDATHIDIMGALLAMGGLVLLLVPLLEGTSQGWPFWTWASLVLFVFAGTIFVGWEHRVVRHGATPVLDPAMFSNRGFALSALCILLVYSTPASLFLCFTMTMQTGLGMTPLQAGSLLTPMSIGFVTASLAAPKLTRYLGVKVVVCGMAIYAIGFVWIGHAIHHLANGSEVDLGFLAGMAFFGFAQGLSGPPLLNIAIGLVGKQRAGMASGVISTVQQLGGTFGIVLAGMVFGVMSDVDTTKTTVANMYSNAFVAAMYVNAVAMLMAVGLLNFVWRMGPNKINR